MSIETINGCVLFANSPDWRSPVEFTPGWSTGVARSASGNEKRSSFRGQEFSSIAFNVFPSTSQAQHRAQARLLQALETGKIAVPIWGQGQPLAADYDNNDSTLTIDDNQWGWSVGDYAILTSHGLDDEDYVYGVVTNISSNVLTLGSISSASFSFLATECIYPVLFGSMDLSQWDPRTIFHSPAKVTISEPIPSGSIGTPTNNTEATYETVTTDRICDQVPVIALTENCGGSGFISWTAIFGASSYNVYRSSTEDGTYSLFDTTTDFEYPVGRPYLENKWWRITAVIGGEESDPSNSVEVEGAYIERTMRALQERNFASLGIYIDWPDHSISATDPGNYPADGFYDADIAAGGAAREVVLIQAIADGFTHGMLNNYTSVESLENATPGASIARYSDGSTTFYAPFTVLPMTVAEGTREAQFNQLIELICALQRLIVPLIWHTREIKQGIDTGPRATPEIAVANALAAFNAASYSAASSQVGLSSAVLDTPGLSPYWTADFRSVKGVRTADLTQHGDCRLYYYLAMDPTIGGSPEYSPFSIYPANNPPVDTDGLLHFYASGVGPNGDYFTTELGEGTPETAAPNTTTGWEILSDALLLLKSNNPVDAEWTYYP